MMKCGIAKIRQSMRLRYDRPGHEPSRFEAGTTLGRLNLSVVAGVPFLDKPTDGTPAEVSCHNL